VRNTTATTALQELLFEWIRDHGGYVHPALKIVEDAPCGCRGVIAATDVFQLTNDSANYASDQKQNQTQGQKQQHSQQQQQQLLLLQRQPTLLFIAIPEHLYMTSTDALEILEETIFSSQLQKQWQQQQQDQSYRSRGCAQAGGWVQQLLTRVLPDQQLKQMLQGMLTTNSNCTRLAENLKQLQPPLLLALLLAYEKSKGSSSFWHPYICSLPEEPPCAWYPVLTGKLQQQQQQQHTIHQAKHPLYGAAVVRAAAAVWAKCSAVAELFGPALFLGGNQTSSTDNGNGSSSSCSAGITDNGNGSSSSCSAGITVADVVWAYGQVVSRAFGQDGVVALAPLIDMLNHKSGASKPSYLPVYPQLENGSITTAGDDSDLSPGSSSTVHHTGAPAAAVTSKAPSQAGFWIVAGAAKQAGVMSSNDEPQLHQQLLSAGEELYISYMDNIDSVTAYVSFGFSLDAGAH
jgi:hypothetical protein